MLMRSVVSLRFRVSYNRIINSSFIDIEPIRSEVTLVHDMGENFLFFPPIRSPKELKLLVLLSMSLILVIKSPEEPRVESKIREKPGIEVGMSKRINLPADPGSIAIEFFPEEIMAMFHVVDHVFVMSAGLIVHRPASVDKL